MKIQHVNNMWDIAKAVWRGKFTILNVCIKRKKKENSQTHYLSSHLKNKKEKQKKPKESRKIKIINIRVEIEDTEN